MVNLSGNDISRVWREGNLIYKRQIKYLSDNEEYALVALADSGYVPKFVARIDDETISMQYVERKPVTDCEEFLSHYPFVLNAMGAAGLRHGDLTEYAVIPNNNRPYIIDWAESRVVGDPRPDKRRVSDFTLLRQTMEAMCGDE